MSIQQYHSSGELREDTNIIIRSGSGGGHAGKTYRLQSVLNRSWHPAKRCLLLSPVSQCICSTTSLVGSAGARVQELLHGLSLYLAQPQPGSFFPSSLSDPLLIPPVPPPTSPFPSSSWTLLLPILCGSPELDNWELSIDGEGETTPPGSRVTTPDTDTAVNRVGSSPSGHKAEDLPAAQVVVSSPWGPAALED